MSSGADTACEQRCSDVSGKDEAHCSGRWRMPRPILTSCEQYSSDVGCWSRHTSGAKTSAAAVTAAYEQRSSDVGCWTRCTSGAKTSAVAETAWSIGDMVRAMSLLCSEVLARAATAIVDSCELCRRSGAPPPFTVLDPSVSFAAADDASPRRGSPCSRRWL